LTPVAILYAARKTAYRDIAGVEIYDEDRDARTFPGGMPVIAHPPCRRWTRYGMAMMKGRLTRYGIVTPERRKGGTGMSISLRRTEKEQRIVDDFNARFPVGSVVMLRLDYGEMETIILRPAEVLQGHTAVGWFDGVSGCYKIDGRVRPIAAAAAQIDRLNAVAKELREQRGSLEQIARAHQRLPEGQLADDLLDALDRFEAVEKSRVEVTIPKTKDPRYHIKGHPCS
jgi:hypothetical protein